MLNSITRDIKAFLRRSRNTSGRTKRRIRSLYAFRQQTCAVQAEVVEQRILPATFVVNSLSPGIGADGVASFTLQMAVDSANTTPEADVIQFHHGVTGTVKLNGSPLQITAPVTIVGNGANQTVLDAQQQSRIFQVFGAGTNLTLRNMTLTNGRTTDDAAAGGGIQANIGTTLVVESCLLINNSTEGQGAEGGAIYGNQAEVILRNTSVVRNHTSKVQSNGGGISVWRGKLTVDQSTISGNTTVSGNVGKLEAFANGGGIYTTSSTVILRQSTVTENRASSGGGIYDVGRTVAIPSDQADCIDSPEDPQCPDEGDGGGGTDPVVDYVSDVVIQNSIIAGNMDYSISSPQLQSPRSFSTPDIAFKKGFQIDYSLIGDNSNYFDLRENGNLQVQRIENVHHYLVGSSNGRPKPNGDPGDYGPTGFGIVIPGLGPLRDNGNGLLTHTLLPDSPALNVASDAYKPFAFDQRGTPVPRVFGGQSLFGSQVPLIDMGAVEAFQVKGPIVVSSAADEVDGDTSSGHLSLREAVALANASLGSNTILFADSLNGVKLNLSLGQMDITEPLTILGNGAKNTIIDAQKDSRIFALTNQAQIVSITGITLMNGFANGGGAIRSTAGASLTLNECALSGNSTSGTGDAGGAIFWGGGTLEIINSTLSGNSTKGFSADGGAIFVDSGTVKISQCTLSGNSTEFGNGAAIFARSGSVTVLQSTVTGNVAAEGTCGGIFNAIASVTINNSIVAGNTDKDGDSDLRHSQSPGILASYSLIGTSKGTSYVPTGATSPDSRGNLIGGLGVVSGSGVAIIDPKLEPLKDNGGPTLTHGLLPGSPALDRGSNFLASPFQADQRGRAYGGAYVRNVYGRVDMGAFEATTGITFQGSNGDDVFVVDYSASKTTGFVTITRGGSPALGGTSSGSILDQGTPGRIPTTIPFRIDGLNGKDTVRVIGTSDADTIAVTGEGVRVNNYVPFVNVNIEQSVLAAGNRNSGTSDIYKFDADSPLGSFVVSSSYRDTIDFSPGSLPVRVDLSTGGTQRINANLFLRLPSAALQELSVIGSSGNDTLLGNRWNNRLDGNGGNDLLRGGGGNDLLFGGLGDDEFIFGDPAWGLPEFDTIIDVGGNDALDFSPAKDAVSVDLSLSSIQRVQSFRTIQIKTGTDIENVIGGSGGDHLSGSSLDNALIGNGGNDVLNGKAGNDSLDGGKGKDTYVFDIPDADEADIVTDIADIDTFDFKALKSAVKIDLGVTSVQDVHSKRTLQLASASQIENVIGGFGNDTLTGNSLNNLLTGGPGNDTYVFRPALNAEADSVSDSSGIDTLDFSALAVPIEVSLNNSGNQRVHTLRTLSLNSSIQFENVIGGSGNDLLTGNANDNLLEGNGGNDLLNGKSGSDTLNGGIGNDRYIFDPASRREADRVSDAGGVDTLDFSSLTIPVMLDLGSTQTQNVHNLRTLQLGSASQMENAVGGSNDDILFGNSLNNTLTGNNGNDVLIGGAGNDELWGGAGRDILIGGLGADLLHGGANQDILIAGRTIYDAEIESLKGIRKEWTSPRTYGNRVARLQAGVGAPTVALKFGSNVFADNGERDLLTGDAGIDWYFSSIEDVLTDLENLEINTMS